MLEGHSDWVTSVSWSQDGSRLVSASYDKTVKIWDAATGQCTSKLEGHSDWVTSIAWSHDGSRLVSASGDDTVRIWDPTTGQCTLTLEGHSGWVSSIAWSQFHVIYFLTHGQLEPASPSTVFSQIFRSRLDPTFIMPTQSFFQTKGHRTTF
jgi:WD40 repeat protein